MDLCGGPELKACELAGLRAPPLALQEPHLVP